MASSDEGDIEQPSPATSESGTETPTSSPSATTGAEASPDNPPSAPLPPRWRFVNEAKKAAGYSSLSAGSYIKGQSADELGAKYVAPDISLYAPAKEEANVNRVSFSLPWKEVGKEETEVGRLSARSWHGNPSEAGRGEVGRLNIRQADPNDPNAPTGSFRGLPKSGTKDDPSRQPFKEWDPKYNLSPKGEREGEWHDGKMRDSYTMPSWNAPGNSSKGVGKIGFYRPGERDESFAGEVPKGERESIEQTEQMEGIDCDDPREGALFVHNDGDASNGGKGDDATSLTEHVKKRRCLYLALLLLLAIVAALGAVLGTKNNETAAAAAAGGVLVPVVNETAVPSLFPSAAPLEMASESPSAAPTGVPSAFPTASPSTSAPTESPVVFLGGCPEPFSSMSAYGQGIQVESAGMVYECRAFPCPRPDEESFGGSFGSPPPMPLTENGWKIVGSCSGTRAPTKRPTAQPSAGPSKSPTPIPTPAPVATTPLPTPEPTCSTERDFNLCIALDMSGSVCNDGSGSECLSCRSSFLPIFFTSECRDTFVDEDTCCDNFGRVKDFSTLMVRLLGGFEGDKDFSVVQFATRAQLFQSLSSEEETVQTLGRLDYTGGMTNHGAAINLCQQTFPTDTSTSRQNFILLVTDGVSSEPSIDPEIYAEQEANEAKRSETKIIPVFISPTGNDWTALAFMRQLSSTGRVFDVTDFGSLNTLQEELADEVSCS
ncbi:hypothetical protein ACHAXT_012948 [Thalassiosira profunda]